MEGLTLDRDMFARGMGMVFHGLGLVFDSIGAPGSESLAEAGMDAGQDRADKEKASKPAARKRTKAEKPKEEPAAEAKEEPAAEVKEEPAGEAKEPIQETEKTEAGKTDGAPSADAPLLTYEQVVNIITKRINRAQAEGDTGFSERLKGLIEQMGFSKVSEMPADRYEEFMALLAFL